MSGKPKGFSFETIEEFDQHIDLSIPTYSNLCESILRMSTYFIKPDSTVYDLGCSTGKMLSRMAQAVPSTVRLIGIDVADNLLKEAGDPRVEIHRVDLTTNRFVMGPADLVLSIFTLQFLPVAARAEVIRKAYDALQPGGALIIAEKLFVDDGFIQDVFTFGYYDMKLKNFTSDEVMGKQLSLRTIMRPQTERENLRMLSCFDRIYPFWQYLQFRAWLCIK